MTSKPRVITYIHNPNKRVFHLLTFKEKTYGWCIVPRDSQKQLFRSQIKIVLTPINIKKEKYLLKKGFYKPSKQITSVLYDSGKSFN